MNSSQVEALLHTGKFKHSLLHGKLIATHISYVIISRRFAFKIKKKIKYSFLDFSTLKKRKHFCEREVALNNRLSKGVYLGVVPVRKKNNELIIDGAGGKIIDYVVKMKRLQEAKQMHLMIRRKQVTKKHIKTLADLIRSFHERTKVIKKKVNLQHFADRFNDILSVKDFITGALGSAYSKAIAKAIQFSDNFLRENHVLFEQRNAEGFIRDCHGDLHSRNIFLYRNPVIFDCIEFNDEFRQTDVLDELAFFCMDLEAEGCYALSKAFTGYYFSKAKKNFGSEEHLLFTYYKCYRANVRAKVNALRAKQADEKLRKRSLSEVKKYLELMNTYLIELDFQNK